MLIHEARQSSIILLGGYNAQCQIPDSEVAARAPTIMVFWVSYYGISSVSWVLLCSSVKNID